VLGTAAVCSAAFLLWRKLRRGTADGSRGSDQLRGNKRDSGESRPNPASAASRRLVSGDVQSLWRTAAEGGAGTAAAAARAEALREVLLLRGNEPLPPRPSET
jgi:hypothetical protein